VDLESDATKRIKDAQVAETLGSTPLHFGGPARAPPLAATTATTATAATTTTTTTTTSATPATTTTATATTTATTRVNPGGKG